MTQPRPYRVMTQDALTGEWLTKSLPLTDLEYGPELSGPGSLTGTVKPQIIADLPSLTTPAATLIYVEEPSGDLWGGIIWDARPKGEEYALEAASWPSYLMHRYDWDGELGGRGPYVYQDCCQVIRDIWAYAQSVEDGNLGVIVDPTTSKSKVGTPAEPWHSNHWDNTELGNMIDDLVSVEGAPDYTALTEWNAARTAPVRRIRLGYPRLGRVRTDISFASGVNIIDPPEVPRRGDDYAQAVLVSGTGDGRAKRKAVSVVRNGRLRMEAVVDAPDIKDQAELGKRAAAERAARSGVLSGDIAEITVRHHPAAPLGSWEVGDDVAVRVHNSSTDFRGWCRITGWTTRPYADGGPQATLQLARSDSFIYGAA